MLQVALTGNIGSGKTTVCHLFEQLGVPVYHADERGRRMLSLPETRERIRDLFGNGVIDRQGQVDRKLLARLVFDDKTLLDKLNALIHPMVRDDYRQWAKKRDHHPYVIQEAAIVFETQQASLFDKIVMVSAPLDVRVQRVMQRDGVGREDVMRRARHQWEEVRKLEKADYVVVNDGKQAVIPQVLRIHESLEAMAANG